MTRIERPIASAPASAAAAPAPATATAAPAIPARPAPAPDAFAAARASAGPAARDAVADLVAIRGARSSQKKLVVDAALIQKYTGLAVAAHTANPGHRGDVRIAMAEAQVDPALHAALLEKGEQLLRTFVAGLKGKRFADEKALGAAVAAEIAGVKFRETADPLHFYHGRESAKGVADLELPKAQVELLRDHGLRTGYDVLQRAGTTEDRAALRKELGLGKADFERLVTHADLTRCTDLGGFYADALRRAGIDSVTELASQDPKKLQEKLAASLKSRHLDRYVPGLERCENWVRYAQHLPRVTQTAASLSSNRAAKSALAYWESRRDEPIQYFPSKEAFEKVFRAGGGANIDGPWIWRQKQDANAAYFQVGVNDLNHQDIKADRKTGAITVVAEH